jgi:hypothetical protein
MEMNARKHELPHPERLINHKTKFDTKILERAARSAPGGWYTFRYRFWHIFALPPTLPIRKLRGFLQNTVPDADDSRQTACFHPK